MLYQLGRPRLSIVLALVALAGTPRAQGAVHLQWRPTLSSSVVGDVVEIGLYAVSDTGSDPPIAGLRTGLSLATLRTGLSLVTLVTFVALFALGADR